MVRSKWVATGVAIITASVSASIPVKSKLLSPSPITQYSETPLFSGLSSSIHINGFLKAIFKNEKFGLYNIGNDDGEINVLDLVKICEEIMETKINKNTAAL